MARTTPKAAASAARVKLPSVSEVTGEAKAVGGDRKTLAATKSREPVGRRRQLVDAEIYTVATELFSTKGYGSTSLQDIADAMGLSRPALYHYVSSKEEILAKLVEEFAESKASELNAVISNPELRAAEKLSRVVTQTVRGVAEHPQRFRLLDRCENELPQEIMTKHLVAKRAVRDAFVSVLTEGVSAGQFRSVDPSTAAFALIGMCTWVAWWFTPEGQADVENVVRSIAGLAINMVVQPMVPGGETPTPVEALQSIRLQMEALEIRLANSR